MKPGLVKHAAASLVFCAIALAGCSPPPVPDVTYFRLPAPAALPHADRPLSLLPIEVDVFGAEGVYTEQSLIYTVAADGNALRTYHYQLWSDPPTHALQTRLVVMLRESGISGLVTDRLPASTQALRIHGTIRRYERSGNGGTFTVSVAVEMRVEQDSGEPLVEQDYHADVPAADATLDGTVKAFGTAVDQIFAAFYRDLVALEGEAHAG
jgi:cholesterol transport system auxiliary component